MESNNVPSPKTNLCDIIPISTVRNLGKILTHDLEKLEDLKGCPDRLHDRQYKRYRLDDLTAREKKTGHDLLSHWGNRGMTVQELIHLLEELHFERALKCIKPYDRVRLVEQSKTRHTLEEGETLVLECRATGFPYPDYDWFKVHDEMGKNKAKVCAKHNDGRFEIKNAHIKETGSYICKIHHHKLGKDGKPWSSHHVYSDYFKVTVVPSTKPYKPHLCDQLGSPGVQNIPGRPLVTLQPEESLTVYMGQQLRLSCHAIGSDNLKYYWHKNNTLITGQGPELSIEQTTLMDNGRYHCCIRNTQGKEVKTNVSNVKVFPQMQHWLVNRPRIVKQPTNKTDQIGGKVVYVVEAEGVGALFYQWFKDGAPMAGEDSNKLQIEVQSKAQAGTYQCQVCNDRESVMSRVVTLQLESSAEQYTAKDKIALILGASDYMHQASLPSIKNDASAVTKEFTQLGFKVISLIDLTLEEMHNAVKLFISLIDSGVYAVVYVAGHGFTHKGYHYFIPWDAPVQVQPNEALCIEEIENRIQEKQPEMLVLFLDICRKECKHVDTQPGKEVVDYQEQPKQFLGNRTIFFAASHLEKAFSLEKVQKDCTCTHPWGSQKIFRSIFSQILSKVIWQDVTLPELWIAYIKEHKAQHKDEIQHPEVKCNLNEPGRKLTDPIVYDGNTAAMNQRSYRWQAAHKVPHTSLYKVENLGQFEVCYDMVTSNILEVNFVPHFNAAIAQWKVKFAEDKIPTEIKPIKFIKSSLEEKEKGNEDKFWEMHPISYRINSLQRLKRPLALEVHIAFRMVLDQGDEPLQCECPPVLLDLGQPLISFVFAQHIYSYKEPEEQEESVTEDK